MSEASPDAWLSGRSGAAPPSDSSLRRMLRLQGEEAQRNRRQKERLAPAPEAVAERPVAQALPLGVLSRPEPPGAP
eukprot:scaffold61852_cov34-Phaeocystis_antarctica.AAC.2